MDNRKIFLAKCFILSMFLLLLFISPSSAARHEIYSDANSSDEGIYLFFSGILEDEKNCMDKFVEESPDADNLATSLESVINLAEGESIFYAARGYKSNVSGVVKPFTGLSGGVRDLTTYQSVFLANNEILKREDNTTAYMIARSAVFKMRVGADEINSSLDEIESAKLYNESAVLLFNVSGCRMCLIDVYALIDTYEYMLEWCVFEGLYVVVSDEHPFLFQDIGIQVYSKNAIPLSLVIDDCAYQLEDQIDQVKRYNFKELGEYTIYAEGRADDGEFIRSNIVKIDVDKIPTFLFLASKDKALLEENVKITGALLDYFNNPILAELTINTGDRETVLMTDEEGYFQLYGTKISEGYLNVSAFYPGNSTYNNSNANISIFFSSLPVKPFTGLSGGAKELTTNQSVFLADNETLKREDNTTTHMVARSAAFKNRSLDEIESTKLHNEMSALLFNASGSGMSLIDVYALIDTYEDMSEG
ncbi:MAG: hypothetical protein D4S01_06195, partial [Dehalococcoidia bacterium]